MDAKNEIVPIDMSEFLAQVIKLKLDQWRMVQICAVRTEDGYELSYSFAKDYDMETLRLCVAEEQHVASITQLYPCAFIQENEMAELFGVKVDSLRPDYLDKLYRIDQKTPFKEKG